MPGELIVIDGPAGAGKSTVARRIAEELGAALLDTGAIYRSLAWLARARAVDWDDEAGLATIAALLQVEFRPPAEPGGRQQVLIWAPIEPRQQKPLDLTAEIRTPDISEGASRVSRHEAVRAALLGIQRAIAATAVQAGRSCVAEGRDMGTVVFPEARHKFFLTASQTARAVRRHQELVSKGRAATVEQVEAEMGRRDQRDSSREAAPLQQAEDALLIDSSELDIQDVVVRVLDQVGKEPPLDRSDGSP